jgi:hypothetical protein
MTSIMIFPLIIHCCHVLIWHSLDLLIAFTALLAISGIAAGCDGYAKKLRVGIFIIAYPQQHALWVKLNPRVKPLLLTEPLLNPPATSIT